MSSGDLREKIRGLDAAGELSTAAELLDTAIGHFPKDGWFLRQRNTKDMTISLPDTWGVYYAGKDYHAECAPMTFNAEFHHDAQAVYYRDEFVQRELEASPEAYAAYKEAIETRARVPKEWIVLERGGA